MEGRAIRNEQVGSEASRRDLRVMRDWLGLERWRNWTSSRPKGRHKRPIEEKPEEEDGCECCNDYLNGLAEEGVVEAAAAAGEIGKAWEERQKGQMEV